MTNENDVRNALKQALSADTGGGPDMGLIIQGGKRQRRAALRKAALGAAVLALAGLGMGYGVTHTQPGSQNREVTPDLAGQARTPSLPPHDNSSAALARTHAALRTALASRLPAGMTLEEGSGPAEFRLVRHDGTVTSLAAQVGLQSLVGLKSPCTATDYNTNCRSVSLPDGSRGWALETSAEQKEGHSVSVVLDTLDGQVWGLSDGAVEPDSAASKAVENGEPLTEEQLISLVSDPQVMTALKQVSTDQITSGQTGQPYRL